MVMANSLCRLLRARHPEVRVDVLAPAWSLPVIGRMAEVRTGIISPAAHGELALGRRRRVADSLRPAAYRQAIVLPRSLKSALIPWFADIPRRTGFRGEMRFGLINDMRPFDRSVLDQTVKRFVALGVAPGDALPPIPEPRLETSKEQQASAMQKLGLHRDRPVIGLMPGAEYGPAKCWPLEYFAKLAARLGECGRSVWVLGSERDRPAGEQIAAASGAVDLCGRTTLEDVIDLLACCEAVVTNDSGLMHVAAAVGTHVIAIYGSTSPAFTPPLTANGTVHHLALDCSPCFRRECPLGHLRCLRELTPDAVFATVVPGD